MLYTSGRMDGQIICVIPPRLFHDSVKHALFKLTAAIQIAILNRLRDVIDLDILIAFQIRYSVYMSIYMGLYGTSINL